MENPRREELKNLMDEAYDAREQLEQLEKLEQKIVQKKEHEQTI